MKKGWRDLSEIEELFERRGQRKMEPCIKLFLAEIGSIVGPLFEVRGSLSTKRIEMLSGIRK